MVWGRDPRPNQEAARVRAETPRTRVEHEITPPREEPYFHSGEQPTHHERKTLGSLWITPPVHEPEPLLPASHGSMEHPPKMFGLTRKAGYLALGIPMGLAAIGLWSFDILAHLTALPFDDVIFHGAAAVATVAAVPLLNAAWRGYGPSLGEIGKNTWSAVKSVGRGIRDSILKGARVIEGTNHVSEPESHTHSHGTSREEYDGRGYPVSATTYAREDLNGRYGSGRIKKAVSWTVLNFFGRLAHSARGIRDEAAERSHRVWSRDNPRGFFGKLGQTFTHVFLGGLWAGAKRGEESYKKDVADGNKYLQNRA